MDNHSLLSHWLARAKTRGQAPLLLTILDAIEPIAPVLAAGLTVAGPLTHSWNGAGGLRELANLLDEPAGIDALRQQLTEDRLE